MDKEIYAIREGVISAVKVLHESPKQYKLGANPLYRAVMRKAELNMILGALQPYVVSEDKSKAVEIWNRDVTNRVLRLEDKLDKLKKQLISSVDI